MSYDEQEPKGVISIFGERWVMDNLYDFNSDFWLSACGPGNGMPKIINF